MINIKFKNNFINLGNIFVDAIFPEICICGKWGKPICDECRKKVRPYKTQLCPVCKKVSENGKTCKNCFNKSKITGVMVYGKHEKLLKDLIWRCKYNFIKGLTSYFGEILTEEFGPDLVDREFLITSVPISKERALWRGFNQSELIAIEISRRTGLKYKKTLLKVNESKAQVGLTRKERLKNLQGKILPVQGQNLKNAKIVIVDDVVTTGATLTECAKVLRKAGAREVWGLVLSRD